MEGKLVKMPKMQVLSAMRRQWTDKNTGAPVDMFTIVAYDPRSLASDDNKAHKGYDVVKLNGNGKLMELVGKVPALYDLDTQIVEEFGKTATKLIGLVEIPEKGAK